MTTLAIAYTFLCLGFCLGFVVCSILRVGQQADSDRAAVLLQANLREADRVANVQRRRKWDGATPPPSRYSSQPLPGRIVIVDEDDQYPRAPDAVAATPPTGCACGYLRCICTPAAAGAPQ